MTTGRSSEPGVSAGRWDSVLIELNQLRIRAGEPSYAELTRRLIQHRVANGLDLHAAHISKSSVHDAFRVGRTRINVPLIRELVQVLDGEPALVDRWLTQDPPARTAVTAVEEPEAGVATEATPLPHRGALSVGLMVACLALNLLGREFVDFFAFPIYLDMAGTAVAAIALGPWHGVAVGLSTNVLGAVGSGLISLPFAVVNAVGALVWGYGVRRWSLGRTLPRFLMLNLVTAVACSATAVPILLATAGGRLRAGHDAITVLVQDAIGSTATAVAFSNVLTSSADKLISGFVALVAISALPAAFGRHVPFLVSPPPSPTAPLPPDDPELSRP